MTRSVVYGPTVVLDAGGNKWTNLANGVSASDAATVGQLSGGSGVTEYDYVQRTTNLTAGAEADYIVGNPVSYDGSTRIRIEAYVGGIDTSSDGGTIVRLYDGTTALGRFIDARGASGDIPAFAAYHYTPSAGSHTFKLTATLAGTGSSVLNAGTGSGGASAYMPAYLRITNG